MGLGPYKLNLLFKEKKLSMGRDGANIQKACTNRTTSIRPASKSTASPNLHPPRGAEEVAAQAGPNSIEVGARDVGGVLGLWDG